MVRSKEFQIARIFLNNPPIIILDEATSALDLESEAIIQDAFKRIK
ncbi:Lipid A export ATP-binding/permease MsbA [Staphylococcus gallinarum]|uniref:Lipid A export ATP-binding/permease MsbA n=1 Tax=Staphylococcus gallinarum TaxID=1293 RepID=A0A380FKS2_STAGA|nr:Lipid A export ATP-binding/permease MsbA [Staphylococcus gallinarum]